MYQKEGIPAGPNDDLRGSSKTVVLRDVKNG